MLSLRRIFNPEEGMRTSWLFFTLIFMATFLWMILVCEIQMSISWIVIMAGFLLFLIAGGISLYRVFSMRGEVNAHEQEMKRVFEESSTLNPWHLKQLLNAVPTSQFDLFQNVLLMSLELLNPVLSSIEVSVDEAYRANRQSITLLDEKIAEIIRAFIRLKANPALYSTRQSEKSRDCAITAFVFYRILYRGVMKAYYANNKELHFSTPDFDLLLKRMPPKLGLYLGAQYWRLYEFKVIVDGNLSELKLNDDIASFIEEACCDITPPKKALLVEEHSDKANGLEQELAPSTKSVLESNQVMSTFQEMAPKSEENSCDVEKFIEWLQAKMDENQKRYKINSGGFLYTSTLTYGKDSVFITDPLLAKYQDVRHTPPDLMKNALVAAQKSDGKTYFVQLNEKKLPVIRIQKITITQEEILPVHIEEEKDNGS